MSSPATHQDRPILGISLRLLATVCFATTFMLVKYIGEQGGHLVETLFYRYLTGTILLGGYIYVTAGRGALKTKRIGAHFNRALVGMVAMALNFGAVLLLPLAEAATLSFTMPMISTLLSVLILKETVGLHRWSAVLIGFIGIVIAVQPGGGTLPLLGVLAGLGGAAGASMSAVLVRDLARTEATSTIVFYYMALATPVLGVFMIFYGQGHDWSVFGLFLALGLVGTLGMLLFSESLRLANIAVLAPVDYAYFIFAAAYGYLIWGDWPQASVWFGLPLIVGSGVYVAYREHKRRKVEVAKAADLGKI